MKNIIKNICFCADGNYVLFIPSVIESVLNSNTGHFIFHIISDEERNDIFDEKLNLISDKVDVIWHKIDIADFEGLKEVSHFTKAMYYRFSIPELINADRVLYLDCDIIVRGNIEHLFELEFGEDFIAAVSNPLFNRHEKLNITYENGYFNSGVMLINTNKWLKCSIKEKLIHVIDNEADILEMPDQDALNKVFNGKWYKLPSKYNAQYSMFQNARELKINNYYRLGIDDPCIVHFSGTNKQWHYSCGLSYAKDYKKLKTSVMIPKRTYIVDRVIGIILSSKIKFNLCF